MGDGWVGGGLTRHFEARDYLNREKREAAAAGFPVWSLVPGEGYWVAGAGCVILGVFGGRRVHKASGPLGASTGLGGKRGLRATGTQVA